MDAKFFSYKVSGINLQPVNENLKLSNSFDRKEILNELKELLKEHNFKLDPNSMEYKIIDDEIFVTGLAVEDQEPKSIGFMTGK